MSSVRPPRVLGVDANVRFPISMLEEVGRMGPEASAGIGAFEIDCSLGTGVAVVEAGPSRASAFRLVASDFLRCWSCAVRRGALVMQPPDRSSAESETD